MKTIEDLKRAVITTDNNVLPPFGKQEALVNDGAKVIDEPTVFPSRYIGVVTEKRGDKVIGEVPYYAETEEEVNLIKALPFGVVWLTHPKIGRLFIDEVKKEE